MAGGHHTEAMCGRRATLLTRPRRRRRRARPAAATTTPTCRRATARSACASTSTGCSRTRVTVPAGRVRIVGRNVGRLTHNVAVVQFDRPLGDEQERQYARTATAHPGERVSTTVTLKPGQVPARLHDRQPRQPRAVRRAQGRRRRETAGGARRRPGCRRCQTIAVSLRTVQGRRRASRSCSPPAAAILLGSRRCGGSRPRKNTSGSPSGSASMCVTAPTPIVWSPPGCSVAQVAGQPGQRAVDHGHAVGVHVGHGLELLARPRAWRRTPARGPPGRRAGR